LIIMNVRWSVISPAAIGQETDAKQGMKTMRPLFRYVLTAVMTALLAWQVAVPSAHA
jgi:hypothetical protein